MSYSDEWPAPEDGNRTAFLYPRPDGKHWFPTIVETLEAERDALKLELSALQRCIAAVQTEKDGVTRCFEVTSMAVDSIAEQRDRAIRQRDHARALTAYWHTAWYDIPPAVVPSPLVGDDDDGWGHP